MNESWNDAPTLRLEESKGSVEQVRVLNRHVGMEGPMTLEESVGQRGAVAGGAAGGLAEMCSNVLDVTARSTRTSASTAARGCAGESSSIRGNSIVEASSRRKTLRRPAGSTTEN